MNIPNNREIILKVAEQYDLSFTEIASLLGVDLYALRLVLNNEAITKRLDYKILVLYCQKYAR